MLRVVDLVEEGVALGPDGHRSREDILPEHPDLRSTMPMPDAFRGQ
jgi:hypothetical protein